jgi:hypothetical protein
MIRVLLTVAFFVLPVWSTEFETTFENSNFILSMPIDWTGEHKFLDYNRLRMNEHIRDDNWFAVAILDIENYLGHDIVNSAAFEAASSVHSDTPFVTQTEPYDYQDGQIYAQLYRFYAGYADEKHRISLGLQKISFGVGRIWNPTDLFNPKNPLALEPDEVYGVFSTIYTYSPNSLSQINAIVAQRADESFKYAGRAKSYIGFADVAINTVIADDVTMIGYELEGELGSTGIALRSEGGWFYDKTVQEEIFQGLIGADYAFKNSLVLMGEWLHTSKVFDKYEILNTPQRAKNYLVQSHDYVALGAGYEFDTLLYGMISSIVSIDDNSFYITPSLRYSLADDRMLVLGAMLYDGETGSEFGDYGQTYYVNLKVTF